MGLRLHEMRRKIQVRFLQQFSPIAQMKFNNGIASVRLCEQEFLHVSVKRGPHCTEWFSRENIPRLLVPDAREEEERLER